MYVNCTDCQDGSNQVISDLKDLGQSPARVSIVMICTCAHTAVEIISVIRTASRSNGGAIIMAQPVSLYKSSFPFSLTY